MGTEGEANDFMQEKFMANIILKEGKGDDDDDGQYNIRVRCTYESEGITKTTEQDITVDPRPSSTECVSKTLKAFGTCKDLMYITTNSVDGAPPLLQVGGAKVQNAPPPKMTSAEIQEQLKENEKQAEVEATVEMKEANASEKTAEEENRNKHCPVSQLEGLVNDDVDEETAFKELETMKLTEEEKKVLEEDATHGAVWKDCTPQQQIAMVKKFRMTMEKLMAESL